MLAQPHVIHYLPILTTCVSVAFFFTLIQRYRMKKRGAHLLWWAAGVACYGLGTAIESSITLFGNSVFLTKSWFIAGALLGGYPLAQGTVYLLLRRRTANRLTLLTIPIIVIASVCVAMSPVDPDSLQAARPSGSLLQWQWIRSGEGSQRFRNVALAASRTGQPNILEVFDAGTLEDGRLYMVMEYIEGYNLYAEIQQHGRLPTRRACRIMRAIARAVRAAHDAGIIHRDLKPINVMYVPLPDGEGEAVQVFDFGISAWAEAEARLTDPSVFIGTPEYMAPEQVRGSEPTPMFDIYALGVVFFEILVGEPPFSAGGDENIMLRKISERAPSLGERRPELPHNLIMLVDDCLSLDPSKRPQSAREFLERIELAMQALNRRETVSFKT